METETGATPKFNRSPLPIKRLVSRQPRLFFENAKFRLAGSRFSVWLDGRSTDSYHLVCIVSGAMTIMTWSTKKHRSQPEKAGVRHAVAEAKVFMTGRSQAVRLPKEYRVTGNS